MSEAKVVSIDEKLRDVKSVETKDSDKTRESKVRSSVIRVGSIIGKTILVCTVSTPFVVFAGTKIVDYMNETGVRTLRDGMDQQKGEMSEFREDLTTNGVAVELNLTDQQNQGQAPNTTVSTTPELTPAVTMSPETTSIDPTVSVTSTSVAP